MTARYKARPIPVQAIQLRDLVLTYQKWGGTQHSKPGDWLLSKGGDVYTCADDVFVETYCPLPGSQGWFYKEAFVDAVRAASSGQVATLEGSSSYEAGDYIVTNPGGDRYCIGAAKFLTLYARADLDYDQDIDAELCDPPASTSRQTVF